VTPIRTTRAARVTETEISRSGLRSVGAPIVAAFALLGAVACGGSKQGPFSWVTPRAAPKGWNVVRIPTGAQLAYPPGWTKTPGDRGTATAALVGAGGRYLGYLNVTPQQGAEKLTGWASFRVSHNAEEGDRDVKRLAAATGLRFLDGTGSCVEDSYTTSVGARYTEIACIVKGPSTTSVIVGAAPPVSWAQVSPQLERAISGFRA
jgi:hypothetical protein